LEAEVKLAATPKMVENGGQATANELKELNLRTKEDPRSIYVSTMLMLEEEKEYFSLLSEYMDVFAWSYKEMPNLDPKIAVHSLAIKKGVSPKRHPERCCYPELILEIEKAVNKLIDIGFIREVKYPTWIANIYH